VRVQSGNHFYNKRIADLDVHDVFDGVVTFEVLENIRDDDAPAFMEAKPLPETMPLSYLQLFPLGNLAKKALQTLNRIPLRRARGPFFREMAIVGHNRTNSLHRKIFSIMNIVSRIFYSDRLSWKYQHFIDAVMQGEGTLLVAARP